MKYCRYENCFLLKLIHIFYLFEQYVIQQILFSYSCTKSCTNYDFYYVFIRKFVKIKNIYFEWMRNFVQAWFRIDAKMMRNFVQKMSFRAKMRNCCARESTVSWKPYSSLDHINSFNPWQVRLPCRILNKG